MFYRSNYGPAVVINILWNFSCRIPVMTTSLMLFAKHTSELLEWYRYFRDIVGYFEDLHPIMLGGEGKIVEGDGM